MTSISVNSIFSLKIPWYAFTHSFQNCRDLIHGLLLEMSEPSQNVGTTLTGGIQDISALLGYFYSREWYRPSSHLRNSGTVPIAIAELWVGPGKHELGLVVINRDLPEGYFRRVLQLPVPREDDIS